ncbi:Ig-like domain-containing protein, partial [Mesorhizobium japonicum]|uniref:Ig-like domain-containing protein n=1 Tax=Mesorhizobium japonicum TaxID=2066070 RepID=UPI003B5BCCDC
DYITNDSTLVVSGSVNALAGNDRVEVRFNGGSWLPTTLTGALWSSTNPTTTLADNSYTLEARVIDTAGTVRATDSKTVVVDTVAPTGTVVISAISDDNGISATDFVTNDQTLLI